MYVPVEHIKILLEKKICDKVQFDTANLKFTNAFKIQAGKIKYKTHVDLDYIEQISAHNIEQIAVCINKEILNELRKIDPKQYPVPQFEENIEDIRERLIFIDQMNKYSNFQRVLLLKQDVLYAKESGKHQILYRLGDKIDNDVLDTIEKKTKAGEKVQYSYNEEGVLAFVDNPVENIKLKIDLLAILSQTKYEIYYGETLKEAVSLYHKKKPKIIITTHIEKSWESKALYLDCYENDPFVKFINLNGSPAKNRETILKKIVDFHNDNYEDAFENFMVDQKKQKPNLESKHRNPLMDKINAICDNYSKEKFIEMKYYLYKLSKKYNVKTLFNILNSCLS